MGRAAGLRRLGKSNRAEGTPNITGDGQLHTRDVEPLLGVLHGGSKGSKAVRANTYFSHMNDLYSPGSPMKTRHFFSLGKELPLSTTID